MCILYLKQDDPCLSDDPNVTEGVGHIQGYHMEHSQNTRPERDCVT